MIYKHESLLAIPEKKLPKSDEFSQELQTIVWPLATNRVAQPWLPISITPLSQELQTNYLQTDYRGNLYRYEKTSDTRKPQRWLLTIGNFQLQ